MHYIDTSVLTACYCPEPRSGRAQRALTAVAGPAISPLVEVEFACAVARKVRAGALERAAAVRVLSEFQRHVTESRLRLIEVSGADYAMARDWVSHMATPLRVLDAIHLAVAFAHNLPLLTADKALAESARHFGVKCRFIS